MRSKLRTVLVLAAIAGTAVMLGGCTSSAGTDPADLEGTWVLESFGGVQELEPADPTVTTEMTLDAGKSSGSGGVNSFTGTYEATDDAKISFGPIAATKMAGPPEAMEQEEAFFKALEKAKRYELNEGKLVLGTLGNDTLVVMTLK